MTCRQAIQTARFLGVPPVCVGVHEARGILAKKEEEVVVSSTVFQNNVGAYLELCTKENIIITKNGKKRAVLLHYPRNHDGLEAGEPAADYGTSPPAETGGLGGGSEGSDQTAHT